MLLAYSLITWLTAATPGPAVLLALRNGATRGFRAGFFSTLGNQLGLIPENTFNFLWVTEFPLFEYSEEEKRYVACHHPFTSPAPGHLEIMNSDPARALARAYDMVLNGNEVGGGSIRIHSAEVQRHMFQALGFTPEQAEAQFGFLIQALEHGAPPHGGLAFGLDRLVMLVLPNTRLPEAQVVAEKLRQRLGYARVKGVEPITLSFGLVESMPDEPLNQLMARVDRALYRAKLAGKDQLCG